MEILLPGREYGMWQLGSKESQIIRFGRRDDLRSVSILTFVTIDRSRYLNNIISCNETGNAIAFLEEALGICGEYGIHAELLDKGHVWLLWGTQRLVFVKRSGGAIQYEKEWPGVQTQEVFRVLIDYCCKWPELQELYRHALFEYEVRAWRRKQEGVNREKPTHLDDERPRPWRNLTYNDAPFDYVDIEKYKVANDGHLIVPLQRAA